MPINLIILTNNFVTEPKDVREGISYRSAGLYGSLVKALLNCSPESKIFWYSSVDRCLRLITRSKMLKSRCGMFRALLGSILTTLKGSSYLVVIVAYPSSLQTSSFFKITLEYTLSLLALRIFNPARIRVIVDNFDPPITAAYAHSEVRPSILMTFVWHILNMLSLKSASLILLLTESYKQYMTRANRVKERKILIVPCGALVRYIKYVPPKSDGAITLLYSGSARRVKDIDKLVVTVNKLRRKGLQIDLHIAGVKQMDLPLWVHNAQYNWPRFVSDILSKADIGIIPYPPNRLHFSYTMPAKLSDYMAAGKPVISTNLKETSNIIKMFNCGLVARDWKEFELHIEKLYYDRELAKKLGENGRKAAEKYLNIELLADALLKSILKTFEVEH